MPSAFHLQPRDISYRAICIWDALGIATASDSDALISAQCARVRLSHALRVTDEQLTFSEGVIHFAVPAAHWWDNIGYVIHDAALP